MKSKPNVAELMPIYDRWLPSEVIARLVRETKKKFYSRVLPPILVLWGFIFQRLNHDHSCDAAWSYLSSDTVLEQFRPGKPRPKRLSESSSAYCQARKRLPLSVAQGALSETARALHQELGEVAAEGVPAVEEEGAVEEVVEERGPIEEAFIETARCNTCDECTKKNDKMFAYNEDKKAYFKDIDAGTFKDLVEAAELCKVAIIHPGKPRNPDEPNLEELIKRAEPFN